MLLQQLQRGGFMSVALQIMNVLPERMNLT